MAVEIRVYGADWCHDTARTLHHLKSKGIPHDYINVDQDDAASQQVMEWNGGRRITPTVIISPGHGNAIRLSEPENDELDEAIRQQSTRSDAA